MKLKHSLRIIFRNKTYSLLNIAGLTIGITASALLLLWVEYFANNKRDVPDKKRIYEIGRHQRVGGRIETTFTVPAALFENIIGGSIPEIRRSSRFLNERGTFAFEEGNKSIMQYGAYVDSALFNMIDLPFITGNRQTAFATSRPIVISQRMSKTLFGDDYPLGKALKMNNAFYEVTGVFKDREPNGTFRFDWLIPYQVFSDDMASKGRVRYPWANWIQCYVETYPKTDIKGISERLTKIRNEKDTELISEMQYDLFLYSISDRMLYGEFKDGKSIGGNIRTMGVALI